MPGTATTVTERGGLRADAQTVDAISGAGPIVPSATKSAPAPVVTKKFLRMRFGDFLPARGKWWAMIVDNGFPGGDPLNNVASFGGDAAVEGTGVTIDIPGNREYRDPINILLNGTLPPDIRWTMEAAFTTMVVSSWPLSGPNSTNPGTVVFEGIHDLDLQRVRIPGPATAILSVVVHTSFDDVN